MFDQDADEAFQRSDDRPVQHHRHLAGVVLGDVFSAEALGHLEVDLHRAAGPGTSKRIPEVVVDLRAVDGAIAG